MAHVPSGLLGEPANGVQAAATDERSVTGTTKGLQKALSIVDLELRLDIGGEVVETVLSVLEGEPYG